MRLEDIETMKRRGVHFEYVSYDEHKTSNHNLKTKFEQDEERFLRVLFRADARLVG